MEQELREALAEQLELELDAYTQTLLLHPMNMPTLKKIARKSILHSVFSILKSDFVEVVQFQEKPPRIKSHFDSADIDSYQ